MNKLTISLSSVCLVLFAAALSIVPHAYKSVSEFDSLFTFKSSTSIENASIKSESKSLAQSIYSIKSAKSNASDKNYLYSMQEDLKTTDKDRKLAAIDSEKAKASASVHTIPAGSRASTAKSFALSRGAAPKGNVELLDWWSKARYVFSVGSVATVEDVYTGKVFRIKRTMGTNHADCEALTADDTEIIKSIWGGFSWARRPVHVIINGRILAASMSAMPHAGLDSKPAYEVVNDRSGGYGTGQNLDVIKNNGMDGHFDVHFLNSTRHKDNEVDPEHQRAVLIAAGR